MKLETLNELISERREKEEEKQSKRNDDTKKKRGREAEGQVYIGFSSLTSCHVIHQSGSQDRTYYNASTSHSTIFLSKC